MSKIGKKPISIPAGVTISVMADSVVVKGPKGEQTVPLSKLVKVEQKEELLAVTRVGDDKTDRAFHGLTRSLLANAVVGVTAGYKKTLKLIGTGYRATSKGASISLAVGFSHPVDVKPMPGISLKLEGQDTIHIEGMSKESVGQMAANIRSIRPPEPYLGKGIRYSDEVVKLKAGKAAAG